MPAYAPIPVRFWPKVRRGAPGVCWDWLACVSEKGYGKFEIDRRAVRAHRVAWELTNGPIPEGTVVMHRCDNRLCCNPAHLMLGTQQANITDMVDKGRLSVAKLTRADAEAIRARLSTGPRGTARALSREYGVTETTISEIRKGKTWT